MQGRDDVAGFIAGFAGDDRYIVDYLVEEVLQRQPEHVRELPAADLDPRPAERPAVRCRHRPGRRQGDAGGARARQPVPRPARRPPPLVPLPPPVRRRAAGAPARRAARRACRSCTGGRASGTSRTASRPRRSATRWPAGTSSERRTWSSWRSRRCARTGRRPTLRRWLEALPDELIRRPAGAQRRLRRGAAGPTASSRASRPRLRDAERWLDADGDATSGARRRRWSSSTRTEFRRLPGVDRPVPRRPGPGCWAMWPARSRHARRALDLVAEDDHLGRGGGRRPPGARATGRAGTSRRRTGRTPTAWRACERAGHLADVARAARSPWPISGSRRAVSRDAMRTYERGLQLAPSQGGPVAAGSGRHARGHERARSASANDLPARRAAPAREPGAGRAHRVAAEPATAGGSRWRASGRPRATWTARSSCSTRRSACTSATSPRTCARSPALRARVLVAQGRLGDALALGARAGPVGRRRPQLPARVRAHHPGPAAPGAGDRASAPSDRSPRRSAPGAPLRRGRRRRTDGQRHRDPGRCRRSRTRRAATRRPRSRRSDAR